MDHSRSFLKSLRNRKPEIEELEAEKQRLNVAIREEFAEYLVKCRKKVDELQARENMDAWMHELARTIGVSAGVGERPDKG
jgi:uncharacterized protein involved in exopolysaccharide biosynthesis